MTSKEDQLGRLSIGLTSQATPRELGKPARAAGRRTREKRFMLTRAEEAELKTLTREVEDAAGIRITVSMLARCGINLILDHAPALVRKIQGDIAREGEWTLPAYLDHDGHLRLEHRLIRMMTEALRESAE